MTPDDRKTLSDAYEALVDGVYHLQGDPLDGCRECGAKEGEPHSPACADGELLERVRKLPGLLEVEGIGHETSEGHLGALVDELRAELAANDRASVEAVRLAAVSHAQHVVKVEAERNNYLARLRRIKAHVDDLDGYDAIAEALEGIEPAPSEAPGRQS